MNEPVYYNDFDPKACAWLRELIAADLIPQGHVDERSVLDVTADDVRGYRQCHWFSGIGGWAFALKLAGWGDQPLWTASCPCQPFSCAGQGMGESDERHLWPVVRNLIGKCRPRVVIGEQVASPDGLKWLAGVRANMEAAAYAFWATDLCAAGVKAPHIRQRLYWLADACESGSLSRALTGIHCGEEGGRPRNVESERYGSNGRLAESKSEGRAGMVTECARDERERSRVGSDSADTGRMGQPNGSGLQSGKSASAPTGHGDTVESTGDHCWLGSPSQSRPQGHAGNGDDGSKSGRLGSQSDGSTPAPGDVGGLEHSSGDGREQRGAESSGRSVAGGCSQGRLADPAGKQAFSSNEGGLYAESISGGSNGGFWDASVWYPCLDGKLRRVPAQSVLLGVADEFPERVDGRGPESGFPLCTKVTSEGEVLKRVALLKGYGNAIVPELAAEFIKSYIEIIHDH